MKALAVTRTISLVGALSAIFLVALLVGPILPGRGQDPNLAPRGQPAAGEKASFDPQGKILLAAADKSAKPKEAADKSSEHFDPQGKRITAEEARTLTPTGMAKACLEFHNSPTNIWKIDVTFNPNTYPYVITGGSIKGTICGSPNWAVTGGSMGPNLTINAKRTGGGQCANTVTIVGHFQNPSSYAGTYGFDGASTPFTHTSLYCCGTCAP